MAVLTQAELTAAVAALEWIGKRADLATVLNKMPAMLAAKKPPAVTKKMLDRAINFLKSQNGGAAQEARIAKGMKIKEWLKTGELEGDDGDTKELLKTLGGMLDSACAHDIVGPNLFRGADGRYYTVVVEAEIAEADDDFVQDVLQELYEDDGEEEDEEDLDEVIAAENEEDEIDAAVAEIEVEEVTVRGEKAGEPYPPSPELVQAAEALQSEVADQLGRPLVDVLDTADTQPLKVADLLDRVEEQAVAGADRIGRERGAEIRRIADAHRDDDPTPDEWIKAAWAEYGAWHLPALKTELETVKRAATAAGDDELDNTIAKMATVVELREKGYAGVTDLDEET